MNTIRTLRIAAALLLLILQCACGGKKKNAEEAEPVTPVETARASSQTIERVVTADAVLYPLAQSAVTPKISAPVRRVLVNRGDHVHQGQLLAELEDRDLLASASESKALYEQAQSQYVTTTQGTLPEDMTKAQADVESARQALDAAQKLYDNRVALVREGALAQKLADDAKVTQAAAQSQFVTAQRHLESLRSVSRESQMKSAQSQVDAAKARVAGAQAQVGYGEIRSPIAGIIADRPVNPGEMATSGSPLITIVNISEIVARANVPVRELATLRVGQTATITAPEGELTGKVTVVSPAVDPASTTVEIWVRAVNKGELMKPGTTAKVSIHAGKVEDAVVIPAVALLSSDEGETQVLVVGPDSLAHERKVETGIRQGDQVQISDGLKAGESVITVGGLGLADKAKVKVQEPAKSGEADPPGAAKE